MEAAEETAREAAMAGAAVERAATVGAAVEAAHEAAMAGAAVEQTTGCWEQGVYSSLSEGRAMPP